MTNFDFMSLAKDHRDPNGDVNGRFGDVIRYGSINNISPNAFLNKLLANAMSTTFVLDGETKCCTSCDGVAVLSKYHSHPCSTKAHSNIFKSPIEAVCEVPYCDMLVSGTEVEESPVPVYTNFGISQELGHQSWFFAISTANAAIHYASDGDSFTMGIFDWLWIGGNIGVTMRSCQ